MNNLKLLSAAVLLVLAKSAGAIEVEPNNDSSRANPLGKENVGKLNRASDVDFFSIDSCLKNDKKECLKYTADDEKKNPLNKAGTDKRREEISLSFTCNNRAAAAATSGGWMLGIHDLNGELQETYPVKPEDCVISDSTLGSFNFRLPSLDSPTYFVSVVSDCAAPIYNTTVNPKDPTKNIVNVNKFVTVATAKQTDIDAAKAELLVAQKAIEDAQADLKTADFAVINSNANIQKLTDALNLSSDILQTASPTLTPATNVSAAFSNVKALNIAAYAMRYSIFTYEQFLIADAAAKNPAIQAAIDSADIALNTATNNAEQEKTKAEAADKKATEAANELKSITETLAKTKTDVWSSDEFKQKQQQDIIVQTEQKTLAEQAKNQADYLKQEADKAKKIADDAKTVAENVKKAADNIKTAADKVLTDATAKDTEAKTKLTEAFTALDNAVKSLNETVKANIDAANTTQNLSKHFDSACKDNYNVGIYTLKDNPDSETKRLEDITSKAQKNLGLEQSGQISSIDDNDIYVVDSDGTSDVPLLFTCNALAIRQSNNWKLSIFNDANGLVNSTLINGSTCGSVFVGDKGGYSFKLPKGSQRYYLAVESACASSTKKDCVVDTSEYSILRDVDKVYSGKLTGKKIDPKSADLKLTNCGLNNNSTISIKAENVNLTEAAKLAKLPVNVQIGSTACRILTPDLAAKDVIVGSISETSEITDSQSTAKDSAKITIGECGADGSKVTISGSKLDFATFDPNSAAEVVIPVKVSIGDFACETKEVFYSQNKGTEIVYSNLSAADVAAGNTTSTATTENTDENIAALSKAKNVGASQTNQITVATDIQTYFVESSSAANFEFSCPSSNRFTNDWVLLTYDSAKKLQSTKIINGSDCGVGQAGDAGTFKFSALSNSPRTYFVVKSACEVGDSVCEVDTSKYTISRIIPKSAPTMNNGSTSTITAPCFYNSCTTTTIDRPVFGAN